MRVTIIVGNFGKKITTDLPETPQEGDYIDDAELSNEIKTHGKGLVVFRRKWDTKTKSVTVYVKEK